VAADLWLWKETTKYAAPDDWVFASPRVKGKSSLRPGVVLEKVIQPAALCAGIKKRIGWNTFRHSYSTTVIANGENVKVVQELMRHASSRCTLDVYTQARVSAKRAAQQRIVEMVMPEDGLLVKSSFSADVRTSVWATASESPTLETTQVVNGVIWRNEK
jgi:integrase